MEKPGRPGIRDAGMGGWFNSRRLSATPGNVPPTEDEQVYYDGNNRSYTAA